MGRFRGKSVRHSLLALLVVLLVSAMQFRFMPFAQSDANVAEALTLTATMLVLVVGLGQQAVSNRQYVEDVEAVDAVSVQADPSWQDRYDLEVIDNFNLFCYFVMALCMFATMCVIARRIGGAVFLYRHEVDKEAHLPDHVMDMLDKSKMDIVNAWVSIKANARELTEVEEVFNNILDYHASAEMRMLAKRAAFAKHFRSDSRPIIYAWLSSAPPDLTKKLEGFVKALHQTNMEQIYATTPPCIRRRLIGAGKSTAALGPALPSSSAYAPSLLAPNQSMPAQGAPDNFEMDDVDNEADDTAWLRTTLSKVETEELLEVERAARRLKQSWHRCVARAERNVPYLAAGLTVIFIAVLSLVIWTSKNGCCEIDMPGWETDGLQTDSCSLENRERGSNCTARCKVGYSSPKAVDMAFTCDRKSVKWLPADGAHAPRCEVDGCYHNNECKRGSLCISKPDGNVSCACKANQMGESCQHCVDGFGGSDCGLDVCDSSPCKNGGSCTGGDDSYTCNCATGFEGQQCVTDVCSSSPCQHGGTCHHSVDGYSCTCTDLYAGPNCDTRNFCASSPCQNEGECHSIAEEGRYRCSCTTGWGGEVCEQNVCKPSPCDRLDPPGMACIPLVGGHNCSCPDGYNTTAGGPVPTCVALRPHISEAFVSLSSEFQSGVSHVVWESSGDGFIAGPHFPFANTRLYTMMTLSVQLWGGGATGSTNGCGPTQPGGAGGFVAFELQIDPMAYGRYVFTIGGSGEDSTVTWSQTQVKPQTEGPLASTAGMPGGPFTCAQLVAAGSCAVAAGQCCDSCQAVDTACNDQAIEVARAGTGTTGNACTVISRGCGFSCGNSDGCPCRCPAVPNQSPNSCCCGEVTDSTGGGASVNSLVHSTGTVATPGSGSGVAAESADGFHGGEGGDVGRSGRPGLLVIQFSE